MTLWRGQSGRRSELRAGSRSRMVSISAYLLLHAIQLAMWIAIPSLLIHPGVSKSHHWYVYLAAALGSFVVMGATLFPLERRGYLRTALLSSIGLIALTQAGLASASEVHAVPPILATLLLLFFCGFNVLTDSQPSLVSRLVPE